MAGFITEFKEFAKKGNAIDMAVGVITGAALSTVVSSLVKDILMPPIGVLLGGVDFSNLFFVIKGGAEDAHYHTVAAAHAAGVSTLNIGLFINSIISFTITLFAIFLFVRFMNRMHISGAATTHDCPYCFTKISMNATKCPHCCSAVKPVKPTAPKEPDLSLKNLIPVDINDITKGLIGKKKRK